MKFRVIFFAMMFLLTHIAYSRAYASDKPSNLQELTEILVKESGTPGLVLLVHNPDGTVEIAASGTADFAKKTPMEKDSQFFIGSISKNLVAVIIFQLQEQGVLSLDDPLSKYVEWPQGDKVNIRMLLNHTSGIPDYLSEVIYAQPKEKIIEFFSKKRSQAEIIEAVKSMNFKFDPGSKQAYSNTNGVLAGMVVVKATGKPLGEVLDERIFKPLKMKHSYLYGEKTFAYPHVRGYRSPDIWEAPVFNDLVDCTHADENLVDAADGSIVSSASDLLTYHLALRGGKILSKESFEMMKNQEPGLENGLGYIIVETPFGKIEGMMGRMHGYSAGMIYHVDSGTHFIALNNSGSGIGELQRLMKWKLEKSPE
jgi:D-alanyl-D-alanine carboxypeptidase